MAERRTHKYSVSIPKDLAEAIRAKKGPGGFSAYVSAAVARQLERDNLDEIIAAGEAEHGPADPASVEAKRMVLAGEDDRSNGAA